jgi:hypothetical protein
MMHGACQWQWQLADGTSLKFTCRVHVPARGCLCSSSLCPQEHAHCPGRCPMGTSSQAPRKLTCLMLPQGACCRPRADESLRGAALIVRNAQCCALPCQGDGWKLSETHNETGQKRTVCASPSTQLRRRRKLSPCPGCHCARHVLLPQCRDAASLEQRNRQSWSATHVAWSRRHPKNLLLQPPNWLSSAPLLPASAKTCCAPTRDVVHVGQQVQRQCDNTVTGCLAATRSLVDAVHCSAPPQLSGLSSSHHQKRSPCAGNYLWACCTCRLLLLARQPSARQGMLRVCALCLSTYRYR